MRYWIVCLAVWGICLSGCQRPGTKNATQKNVISNQVSDVDAAKEGLRKAHPDVEHLRSVLDHINAANNADPQRRPTPLSDAAKTFLKEKVGLTDPQLQQLNLPEFQLLDAHVLDQALVFRDIAQSLGVNPVNMEETALAALHWVARHVQLEDRNGPIDPPDRVVVRGRGSGVERIYVLAALLQQLGLECYAIGDESAANDPKKLWGVGVVIGDDIIVLDPRLGIALPSATPNVPTTLAGLQKDPKALEELVALGYDVPPSRIQSAKLYFALPWPMLAPRMQSIDPLMSEGALHIAIDRNRLLATAQKHGLSPWNSNAAGSPLQVLAEFLPTEEGGLDRAPAGPERRMARFQLESVPWAQLPREFLELQGPFGNQIRMTFVDIAWKDHQPGIAQQVRQEQRFVENVKVLQSQEKAKELPDQRLLDDVARSLMASRRVGEDRGPSLREMLLRGQHAEAIETMVSLSDNLNKLLKLNVTREAALQWVQKAQSAFVDLVRAQRSGDASALNELETRMLQLANDSKMAVVYVQQRAAGPMRAKLSYLIALSKHDQADSRSRQKLPPDEIRSSWQAVADGWSTFLSNFPQADEAFMAHRLRAVALARAGQRDAASEGYRQAAGLATLPLDRVACAWKAKNP